MFFLGFFILGFIFFSVVPLFGGRSGLDVLIDSIQGDDMGVVVGDEQITPVPYIWVNHSYPGGINHWEINETFYRNWLNNTVVWRVEKGVQKDKDIVWSTYGKFTVKKDWDKINKTEKHTIIVDSDEDAFYRILSNTKADKQLIGYEDCSEKQENATNDFIMDFKITETDNYKVVYNWDDYLASDTASKSSFTKQVKVEPTSNKQFFEFNVVSDVKIAKGEKFILDPIYGYISDNVLDSWEWDTEEGKVRNPDSLIRLGTSEYYATVAYGDNADGDGFIRTFKVNNSDGKFTTKTLISKWEYDTTDGTYAGIYNIAGNVYAVVYSDGSSLVKVITTTIWSSNGTCKQDIIDTITLTYRSVVYVSMVYVTGDIYAVLYPEYGGGYDSEMQTISITSAGDIGDAILDTQEFDATSTTYLYGGPSGVMIDSDTILISCEETATDDSWFWTYNITNLGIITNTPADSWEFNTTSTSDITSSFLEKIYGNVFAVAYGGTSVNPRIATFTVSDAGVITKSFIDELLFYGSAIIYPYLFLIDSSLGLYGITFKNDANNNGEVSTLTILNNGSISNAVIDTSEFDGADDAYYAPCVSITDNYFLIVYEGTGDDGWAKTIYISTFSNVDAFITGSGTWTVPSGVNRVSVLVVGGGAGGGKSGATGLIDAGGGGAGGLVFVENVSSIGAVAISPGNTISYSVGAGGAGSTTANIKGANGTMSIFGNLSAAGGGGGGSVNDAVSRVGEIGGCGGGGACNGGSYGAGGTTNQSLLSGWSGSHGFGYNGANAASDNGGGGGGAGGAASGNIGGIGKDYSSVFGKVYGASGVFSVGGDAAGTGGSIGLANSGNGGDCGSSGTSSNGFAGGSGIILIKYIYVEEEPGEVRSNNQVFNKWFLCGNTSSRVNTQVFNKWFSCANTSVRTPTQVFNRWFNCGNTSTRTPTQVLNNWFLCGNVSEVRNPIQVLNNWFLCGNTSSRQNIQVFNYWFNNGNTSSRINNQVFNNWFVCGNTSSRQDAQVFNNYFVCGNTSSRTSTQVFNYWFSCSNVSEVRTSTQIFNHYFVCGNTSTRTPTQVFNRWFNCGNTSSRVNSQVLNNYFICGNTSSRINNQVFNNWFLCGNTTTRFNAQVFNHYFICGNISSRTSTQVSNNWFLCGNTSSRVNTQVLNNWFNCGNTSTRSNVQVFNNYFICGNVSPSRINTKVFDNWFLCGNTSSRTNNQVFNNWFLCGNESIPMNITPANPYNINLLVINPNPGNGTHNTNYLKSNTSGLTTSIDVFYENFTTPPAMIPGTYSLMIVGTEPDNTPVIWNTSTTGVYLDVHNDTTGQITPGNLYVGQYFFGGEYTILRSFLVFNTSSIPTGAVINSGYIKLYVYNSSYTIDDFNVTVQQCRQPIPHMPSLVAMDFWNHGFTGDMGHKNTTGYVDGSVFNISLNALGVADIFGGDWSPTETVRWALVSNRDYMSIAPVNDEYIIFYGYGVDTNKHPRLFLNYTIPSSNWQNIVNLTWSSNSSGVWHQYYKSYVTSNGTVTVPATNFSGVDTYFWHLEWESNHINNGSSQIYTFDTSIQGGGNVFIINGRDNFALGLIIGGTLIPIIVFILLKKRKRKRNNNQQE